MRRKGDATHDETNHSCHPLPYPGGSTYITGINPAGVVSGVFVDQRGPHALLRNPLGQVTTFDYPGASGTGAVNIASNGRVTGIYFDNNGAGHGFVGLAGSLTAFDVPGAGTGRGQGTFPVFNSAKNDVTGTWKDSHGFSHAFLRIAE